MRIGYCHIDDIEFMKNHGCSIVYYESKIHSTTEFNKCLNDLNDCDTLIIKQFKDIHIGGIELKNTVQKLMSRSIKIVSIEDNVTLPSTVNNNNIIDFWNIILSQNKTYRSNIISNSKKNNNAKKQGRPSTLRSDDLNVILNSDDSVSTICHKLAIHKSTYYRIKRNSKAVKNNSGVCK